MIGQTISHYRILAKLGEGGMGVVYKAEDTKLNRTVALKFLAPELTRDPDAKARFIHEAKAAAALSHQNICTIHEIDEFGGQSFIAMECYEGETLKERIARGPLPLVEAVDIAQQIVRGLAKAHEQDIVHRDVKPANIFITNDGLVKVVDFGLAKLAGQTRLTKTGTTVGTVAYLSPEQAQGEACDHRADFWALGATLYEMVTGRLPFRGDHEQAVVYSILNEQPEPLTGLRSGVPLEFERIVGKCLAKDRAERYQTATDLSVDLRHIQREMAGEITTSPFPGIRTGTGGRTRRWPWIAVLVVVVAIIGIAAWKYFLQGVGPKDEAQAIAVIDFSDLTDPKDPITSATLTSLVNTSLTENSPIRVVSPSYLQDIRRRLFSSGPGPITADQALEVARRAGASLLLTGEITQLDSERHVLWRLTDTASGESLAARREVGADLIRSADLVVGEVLPLLGAASGSGEVSDTPSVTGLTTGSEEAYQHLVAGLLAREEGRELDEVRALELAVEIDTSFALAFFELSRTYSREHGLARVYSDRAWDLRSRLGLKDRMRLEAWREWVDYRVKDALSTHQEMQARWPDDRDILRDLLEKLYANWYHEEALEVVEQGLALYPDDERFSLYYWICLAIHDRMDEALSAARARIQRRPQNPEYWDDLGSLYCWMGLPDSAEVAFRHALQIEPGYAYSERGIGTCAYARGDLDGAIEIFEQLLQRPDLGPVQRVQFLTDTSGWMPGLFLIYAEAGRFKESLAVIERTRQYVSDPESELRRVTGARNILLLRMGHAGEVLSWAREAKQSDRRITRLKGLEWEAKALVALDSLAAARSTLVELRATEEYWGGYTLVLMRKLSAQIALAEGDFAAALAMLEEMGQVRNYGGLSDIEYLENLAWAHRLAGHLDDAVQVHQEMLRVYGGHALSHYQFGKLYQELERPAEAEREFMIFLEMWSEADEGLPQVEDARQQLETLQATSRQGL